MRTATSRAVAAGIAGVGRARHRRLRQHRAAPRTCRARRCASSSRRRSRPTACRSRPRRFGAGPDEPRRREPDRHRPARHARDRRARPGRDPRRTAPINPRDTAELRADLRPGPLHGPRGGGGIRAATLRVSGRAPERAERPVAAVDAPGPPRATIAAMPARWLLAALALALGAARGGAAAQTTPPEQTPQALFTDLVVKDPRTSADVRALLTTGAGFVGVAAAVRRPHRRRPHGRRRAGARPGRRRAPSRSTRSRPTGRATAACAPSSAARRSTARRWRVAPGTSSSPSPRVRARATTSAARPSAPSARYALGRAPPPHEPRAA